MKMVLVKNVENVEKAANCHGDKVEMVGPFRPMNIFIGTHAERMEVLRKRSPMSRNDEQEAEELVARGSFDRSTTNRVTFVGYGTGRSVRYRDIVVRLATRLLRFYA
jgi:hypothetical protein